MPEATLNYRPANVYVGGVGRNWGLVPPQWGKQHETNRPYWVTITLPEFFDALARAICSIWAIML